MSLRQGLPVSLSAERGLGDKLPWEDTAGDLPGDTLALPEAGWAALPGFGSRPHTFSLQAELMFCSAPFGVSVSLAGACAEPLSPRQGTWSSHTCCGGALTQRDAALQGARCHQNAEEAAKNLHGAEGTQGALSSRVWHWTIRQAQCRQPGIISRAERQG